MVPNGWVPSGLRLSLSVAVAGGRVGRIMRRRRTAWRILDRALRCALRRPSLSAACLLGSLSFGSLAVAAPEQSEGDVAKAEQGESKRKPPFSVVPIPALSHAPETGLVFGAAAAFYLRPDDRRYRTSNWLVLVAYSTKQLAIATGSLDLYALQDRLFVGGSFDVVRFPDLFYGIGNATRLDDVEHYVSDGVNIRLTPMGGVAEDFYFGGIAAMQLNDLREADEGGLLDTGAVRGASGGRTVGFGVASKYDTRDNSLNATRGELLSGDVAVYRKLWGSQFDYESARFEARKFVQVWFDHVVAGQLLLGLQRGEPPYFGLHKLGGTYLLRGHYSGRYRDEAMLIGQLEYRFPLFWRFGGVAFGGAGSVGSGPFELFGDAPKPAAGAGLRFMLDRDERTNLTLDYGLSRDQNGIYVNLGEVF